MQSIIYYSRQRAQEQESESWRELFLKAGFVLVAAIFFAQAALHLLANIQ